MEWMFIRTFRRDRSRFRSTFLRGEAGCIQKGINGVRVIDSTPLISTAGIAFTSTTKAATTRWRASMARANMRACATTTPIRTGYRSNSPKTTAAASGRPATGLGQHPGRNAGKLLRRRAEPALPGPVPGPRNRAALQHLSGSTIRISDGLSARIRLGWRVGSTCSSMRRNRMGGWIRGGGSATTRAYTMCLVRQGFPRICIVSATISIFRNRIASFTTR